MFFDENIPGFLHIMDFIGY